MVPSSVMDTCCRKAVPDPEKSVLVSRLVSVRIELVGQPVAGLVKTYASPVSLFWPSAPTATVLPSWFTATAPPKVPFFVGSEFLNREVSDVAVTQVLPCFRKT